MQQGFHRHQHHMPWCRSEGQFWSFISGDAWQNRGQMIRSKMKCLIFLVGASHIRRQAKMKVHWGGNLVQSIQMFNFKRLEKVIQLGLICYGNLTSCQVRLVAFPRHHGCDGQLRTANGHNQQQTGSTSLHFQFLDCPANSNQTQSGN